MVSQPMILNKEHNLHYYGALLLAQFGMDLNLEAQVASPLDLCDLGELQLLQASTL